MSWFMQVLNIAIFLHFLNFIIFTHCSGKGSSEKNLWGKDCATWKMVKINFEVGTHFAQLRK